MSFARLRSPGLWAPNSVVEPEEFEQLDENLSHALDGKNGGSYAPTHTVVVGGAGLKIDGRYVIITESGPLPSRPAWATFVRMILTAGGGQGGGKDSSGGHGGGGGEVVDRVFPISALPNDLVVTIGAGGTTTSTEKGEDGEDTIVEGTNFRLVARGGKGGDWNGGGAGGGRGGGQNPGVATDPEVGTPAEDGFAGGGGCGGNTGTGNGSSKGGIGGQGYGGPGGAGGSASSGGQTARGYGAGGGGRGVGGGGGNNSGGGGGGSRGIGNVGGEWADDGDDGTGYGNPGIQGALELFFY